MPKVPRKEFQTFLDTVPATEVYELVAEGITTGKINYNPETVEEAYLDDASKSTSLENYAPTMPLEATFISGDPVLDFLDQLRKDRAVLSAAETTIVNVWAYETPAGDSYPAEQQAVSIQVDDFGGDAATSNKVNFTINYLGDPIDGDFDTVLKTFTPTP